MTDASNSLGRNARFRRREFLIGGTLMTTAVASGFLARRASADAQVTGGELTVPDIIGPWRRSAADGILIPRGEQPEDRTYDDVVTAYYTSASAPSVMLLIAYGSAQTGTTQLHRPEVCYPAAGFHVRRSHDEVLTVSGERVAARAMTATATGRTEQILYWSRVGNDFPTSAMDQRWSVLRYALHGVTADGALVRMSVMSDNAAAALPYLRAFANALVATSRGRMRRLLIGTA